MGRHQSRWIILLLACSCIIQAARADDFRILYAEPVEIRLGSASAPGVEKSTLGGNLRFEAYGRAFDITVEPNERLLSRLPPSRKLEFSASIPYRGVINDQPGSWVRLTSVSGEIYGAIWDGSDLYSIVPNRIAALSMAVAPTGTPQGSVIFRLADTQSGLSANFCATAGHDTQRGAALTQYKALVDELRANAMTSAMASAATITGQIEVATLADSQFRAMYPDNASVVMLARMNVVDGIFSEQVGIIIVPTDFVVFDAVGDPFTATKASSLLQQIGDYRRTHPTVSSRALAHLMTGRDLDGDIAGVGYLASLCDSTYGVSLSEGSLGDVYSPLVIAHELGHNFGAPHDAEAGSACASETLNWLMAPRLSDSNRFSSCSLQQMQPVIAAAVCVLSPRLADVAVTVPSTTLEAFVNRSFDFPVDVAAVGDLPAENVQLSIGIPSGFLVDSAAVPGGVCSINGGVSCQLGDIAAADSRRVLLRVRAGNVGSYQSSITASARVDRNPANNSQTVTFNIGSGSDVAISASPASLRVLVNQPFDLTFDVAAAGAEATRNVSAQVSLGVRAMADSAVVDASTSCTLNGSIVTCPLGDMAPGQRHQIVVRARILRTDNQGGIIASVSAANDDHQPNNFVVVPTTVDARNDVGVEPPGADIEAVVNQPFTYSADIVSYGAEAAANVMLTVSSDNLSVQQLDVESGTCQLVGAQYSCSLGSMPTASRRHFSARLVGTQPGEASIALQLKAAQDDTSGNDSRRTTVHVRHLTEVELRGSTYGSSIEGRTGRVSLDLRSTGHDPIQNVSVTAALPASFTFIGASVAGTPCTSGPANLICIVPSIPAGQSAYLSVEYIADQPGDFPVTFVASAAGDNDPSNNTRNLTVSVRPFLDVRIQAVPQSIDVTPGQVFNMPVIIAADRRPVPNVTLSANLPNYVTAQSASAEGGTCVVSTAVVNCTFSEIAAGTTRQIDISARAETIPDLIRSFVDFTVNASTDLDYGNNRGSVPIRIDWSGDASLAVSQASASATTGQSFSFPTITVSAAERIDEAYVEISLPAMSLVVTADAEGGSCSTSGSGLRCQLSTLMTGTSRRINLTLRANSAGSGTSTIHLSARNDHNAQNDSQTVSLTITDPPPPAGGGGTGDSNGGGGGGDFGELFAGTLAALLLMRRRRRGSRAIMQGHPTGSFPAFRAF